MRGCFIAISMDKEIALQGGSIHCFHWQIDIMQGLGLHTILL